MATEERCVCGHMPYDHPQLGRCRQYCGCTEYATPGDFIRREYLLIEACNRQQEKEGKRFDVD